ncbi:MAG: phosphatase PAP2 family protein [Anaeroplasmataceae bacterium]
MKKKLFIIPIITIALFVVLLFLVKYEVTLKFDKKIMNFIYDVRGNKGNALYYIVRIITECGYFFVIVPLCVAMLIYFKADHRALFIIGTVIAAALLNVLMKQILHRPRPDELFRWMEESSTSFPSGHSATSFTFYLITLLVFLKGVNNKIFKRIVISICIVLMVLVPITRLILGVHYPTDVLGGILVALTVVFTIYPIFLYINEKKESRV